MWRLAAYVCDPATMARICMLETAQKHQNKLISLVFTVLSAPLVQPVTPLTILREKQCQVDRANKADVVLAAGHLVHR